MLDELKKNLDRRGIQVKREQRKNSHLFLKKKYV
jgi:hypothetical protein